ncbi:MAG: peptidoglycan bridge formation glycyltransferase FemA/FemB family protein, partial [Chitinispirillia bacterium]
PIFKLFHGSIQCGPVFQDIASFRYSLPLITEELKRNRFISFELNPFWFNQEATVIEQIIIENQGKCIHTSGDYHYASVRIDLNQSEDEIYRQLKSPLKRQIKKSQKIENLVIRDGREQDCIGFVELFNNMMKCKGLETRINYNYVNGLYEKIIQRNLGFFLIQEYEKKPIAAIIAFLCGNTLVYAYGASSIDNREIPKAHILHWELVKRAKSQMINYYDLGGVVLGIDEKVNPGVFGINRFKYGFSENLVTNCRKHRIVLHSTMYYFLYFIRIIKHKTINNGKIAIKSIINNLPGIKK